MIELVSKYNSYLNQLPELIKNSHYKASYFLKELNLSEPTYYRKLKSKTFNNEEVKIITNLLFEKEFYLSKIKSDLAEAKKDIENGNVKSHETVMKELTEKYLS